MSTRLYCLWARHYIRNQHIYNNYAEKLKQRLRATQQQVAKLHINEAKIKAKIYKNTNTKTFKTGDKVLFRKRYDVDIQRN